MPQTNLTTEILPQESRTELSGAEFLKKLQKNKKGEKNLEKLKQEREVEDIPKM